MIIPVGSDAAVRHRPIVTYILVGIFALVTGAVWIAHPQAIREGVPALVRDATSARWEREDKAAEEAAANTPEARAERAREAAEEEAEKAGHPTAASLAWDLEVAGEEREALSPGELKHAKQTLDEALDKHWISAAEKADLERKLAARPVQSPFAALAELLGVGGSDRPFKGTTEVANQRELVAGAVKDGDLTAAEGDTLLARLAECPVRGDGFMSFRMMIGTDAKTPISAEEREGLLETMAVEQQRSHITAEENKELRALMATHPLAGPEKHVPRGDHAVSSIADVPWYLAPVGEWSNPLRWLVALCVQPTWGEAILGIGLTLSYGLVAEGIIGWRRFLPLLAGMIALVCLWNQFTGLFIDGLMVHAGSTELRACLAGMLLMWVPSNVIHYIRWVGVTLGEFEMPIWLLVALGTATGLLVACLSGLPLSVAITGQLLFPLAGLTAGWVLMRQGVLPPDAWTLPLLWQTRHMNPGDRTTMLRERIAAAEGLVSVTGKVDAVAADRQMGKQAGVLTGRPGAKSTGKEPGKAAAKPDVSAAAAAGGDAESAALTADAEQEILTSVAANELDTALWMWRATRSSNPTWAQPFPLLDKLLKASHQAKRPKDAAEVAGELVRLHPARSRDARLVLASQALGDKKPATAREHLEAIPQDQRPPAAAAQIAKLMAKIEELEAQGVRQVEFI